MKNTIILFTFILLLFKLALADGPPIDDKGKVIVKNIVLKLDAKQHEQVSRTWSFELNASQKEQIYKINKKADIKILNIVTYPYHDCTCDSFIYGIWNKDSSIAVPLEFIKHYSKLLKEFKEDRDSSEINIEIPPDFKSVMDKLDDRVVYIDLQGKAYIKYQECTAKELEKHLKSLHSKFKGKNENEIFLSVFTAPLLNKKTTKLIKSKMKEIYLSAKKFNIDCFDFINYYDELKESEDNH